MYNLLNVKNILFNRIKFTIKLFIIIINITKILASMVLLITFSKSSNVKIIS